MKNSLLIAGVVLGGFVAAAQDGLLNVINSSTTKVFDIDGTTPLAKANGEFAVIYNGQPVAFNPKATTAPGFAAAGLFNGGIMDFPGTSAGAGVSITIEVWDKTTGATYDTATHRASETFTTAGLVAGTTPPNKITPGWTSITLGVVSTVPEPSTYALAALGLGGLFFVSRRK